ncbi:unnamed protein product [Peronospora farinosa]|uniref:GAG-pre-integrase domain-containing protein n=1 Tax=Peronospora farinosa TaxID=134698 RepID=A0ABN8CIB1_9STRA|nr:unnamed protein product [Peronospora farinosa]
MEDTVMAAIDDAKKKKDEEDVHVGTLMHFHQRFGHLAYETIERMAREPNSGIRLTDNQRVTCVTCAQARKTKNAQSKKDTGVHSPIIRIGGVICSYLKGPICRRTE